MATAEFCRYYYYLQFLPNQTPSFLWVKTTAYCTQWRLRVWGQRNERRRWFRKGAPFCVWFHNAVGFFFLIYNACYLLVNINIQVYVHTLIIIIYIPMLSRQFWPLCHDTPLALSSCHYWGSGGQKGRTWTSPGCSCSHQHWDCRKTLGVTVQPSQT